VDSWIRRSKIAAYQEAYDRIAREIELEPQNTVVDIACGTGEVIRRVGSARIVGTDSSPRMLTVAKQKLGRYGIRAEIITHAISKRYLSHRLSEGKVILYLDNCLKSTLPKSFFDVAVSTFAGFSEDSVDEFLGEKFSELKSIKSKWLAAKRAEVQRDHEIYKILKNDGRLIKAVYQPSPRVNNRKFRALVPLKSQFEVVRTAFIPSARIASDAWLTRKLLGQSAVQGYGILIWKKIA